MTTSLRFVQALTIMSTALALSSISMPGPSSYPLGRTTGAPSIPVTSTKSDAVAAAAPWRIVLDIGREPLANGMPFDWARSGCRMPMVIPCDFAEGGQVLPQQETVSVTGPDGAVIKPIQGQEWKLSSSSSNSQPDTLSFSLTFPETLGRRDVVIEGGTTVTCMGRVYTKTEMDILTDEFLKARQITWDLGSELNELVEQRDGPKRWNDQTKAWEKPNAGSNPLAFMAKQTQYWAAKAQQDAKHRQRPNLNNLSTQGWLPSDYSDDTVFVSKGGVVRNSKGAVMGTWVAEPITNRPVSYLR